MQSPPSGFCHVSFQALAISHQDCHNHLLTGLKPHNPFCKLLQERCNYVTLLWNPLGGSLSSSEQNSELLKQHKMLSVPASSPYPYLQLQNLTLQPIAAPQIPCSRHLFLTLLLTAGNTSPLCFLAAKPGPIFTSALMLSL